MIKVYGHMINDMLIKICEKEEYAKSVMNGNLYMKESGYFRKLEDNYRGDIYDGKMPIKGDLIRYNKIDKTYEKFSEIFPGMKAILQAGFAGDDKIPIFCSTIFNENILSGVYTRGARKIYRLKRGYINEMRRFGKYMVIYSLDELLSKVRIKNAVFGPVNYWKIEELYKLSAIHTINKYSPFFNKDIAYRQQNEYRIILPDSNLIEKGNDFYELEVGALSTARILETDGLEEIEI